MSKQHNTIYLADDKDGSKIVVIASTDYYGNEHVDWNGWVIPGYNYLNQRGQELSNFTEVGFLVHMTDDRDWQEYFSVGEFVQLMLGKLEHWEGWYYEGIQYNYNQLKNLCKRIVAGTEETTEVDFEGDTDLTDGCWSAHADIDLVLAQAILDTYN